MVWRVFGMLSDLNPRPGARLSGPPRGAEPDTEVEIYYRGKHTLGPTEGRIFEIVDTHEEPGEASGAYSGSSTTRVFLYRDGSVTVVSEPDSRSERRLLLDAAGEKSYVTFVLKALERYAATVRAAT